MDTTISENETTTSTSDKMETTERVMSVLSGAALLFHEFKKDKEETSKLKMGIAAYLIYRGLSGHCKITDATGLNSSVITSLSRFL